MTTTPAIDELEARHLRAVQSFGSSVLGLILGPAIIAAALGFIALWQGHLTHLSSEKASNL
jgi:hypothetical protein